MSVYGGVMADIFISYASQDLAKARPLAEALEKQGWSVFWDRTIPAGQTWRQVIGNALDHARSVVVLWSEASIVSTWVHEEADDGRERGVLIPVLIGDVRPPIGFRSYQTANLADWDGSNASTSYRQLIIDIESILGPSPAAIEEKARFEAEAEARRKAAQDAARRKADKEAEARHKAEEETEVKVTPEEEAKNTPSKTPLILIGLFVVVGGIGLAVVQPWRSSTPAPTPVERSESQSESKPDVGTGATKTLQPGDTFQDCDVCPEMVVVRAGSFTMGSPKNEQERYEGEGPVPYTVRIQRPFAVSIYEVTKGEYAAFVESTTHDTSGDCYGWSGSEWKMDESRNWRNPGFTQTEADPVACVNWNDARAYADWLRKKTDKDYRLLTEAEWEYAARAGTVTRYAFGDTITKEDANFGRNVDKTTKVGSYPANAWGLHDMHGNVWEWVADCYDAEAYTTHKKYPKMVGSWQDSCERVLRGGSWYIDPWDLHSANRRRMLPVFRSIDIGFRVARTLYDGGGDGGGGGR